MTEENFNYRTSPLFLRNEFNSKDQWKIPIIPKCDLNIISNEDLRVIGFDRIKNNKDTGQSGDGSLIVRKLSGNYISTYGVVVVGAIHESPAKTSLKFNGAPSRRTLQYCN